jgi:hypothetical protein
VHVAYRSLRCKLPDADLVCCAGETCCATTSKCCRTCHQRLCLTKARPSILKASSPCLLDFCGMVYNWLCSRERAAGSNTFVPGRLPFFTAVHQRIPGTLRLPAAAQCGHRARLCPMLDPCRRATRLPHGRDAMPHWSWTEQNSDVVTSGSIDFEARYTWYWASVYITLSFVALALQLFS